MRSYNNNIFTILVASNKKSGKSVLTKKPLQRTKSEETRTASLSKKRSRHSQPRSVSFDTTYEVCPILSLDEYTQEDLDACWFAEEDYSTITNECFKIIKKMQQGRAINARKYCVRGLERMTPEASDLRDLKRMNAYISVLEEQNTQMREGTYDPKKIAKEYRKASAKRCQQEAQRIGERDELFVKQSIVNQ
jgi:hypothetical protein